MTHSAVMPPDDAARLAEFARACKAAARAVSLYPGAHPAIASSLARLAELTARLTQAGPYPLHVAGGRLMVAGAAALKPDPAIGELAALLHRHLIGALTLQPEADTEAWRTLLLLLARPPEDIRREGGIASLWSAARKAGFSLHEVDYAEVLREKQGGDAELDAIVEAALAGRRLEMDDSGMRLLLEIVGDAWRLEQLMQRLEKATAGRGVDAQIAAFLKLAQGLADWLTRNDPAQLEGALARLGDAAGRLTAESMLSLLAQRQRGDAAPGTIDAGTAVVDHMSDAAVSRFVAGSVIAERGASDRLAQAFQALVPDRERQRQLLALARSEAEASELGEEEHFTDLWGRVEALLTSYSDKTFVSEEYGRELSMARTQAVDVERISDDPPERLQAWLDTVSDRALRGLDDQLLLDLLVIERDVLRWRDVAETVLAHAEDLVRAGQLDAAWRLADAVVSEGRRDEARREHSAPALERFGRGGFMKEVAVRLRDASDDVYGRFRDLCHAIGAPVVAPLAEVLSAERDARSRRRLRDILVGFGAQGRESVQRLMQAPNWEVRRTAAYLLREFGGSEGLRELIPLVADSEPLVQREAIQALLTSGSDEACRILGNAIETTTGRVRETLLTELMGARDERSVPLFRYLVRHMNRRKQPALYLAAVDSLGLPGRSESVDALKAALQQGDWTAPAQTRRVREAAARALRRIGTPPALDALREASDRGPRGARAAARAALTAAD
ncbi:MAG TPA: HEAT repeat domain-containing protein [Vicinamibacterales bacterium]|nr:HEAT repeat domain-containing protein [Vicinamibacterales bacterium]